MSIELGQFAPGIASCRKLVATPGMSDDARWKVFANISHEIAGYVARGLDRGTAADVLHDIAEAQGWTTDEDEVQSVISDAFAHIPEIEHVPDDVGRDEPQGNGHDRTAIEPHLYAFPDAATLPPRGWIYGTHYIRGYVVATVAPGGFGKTTLALHEALNMVLQGYRVWYISGEDDLTEISRRIAAFCENGKDQDGSPQPFIKADFGNRFFVDDKITFPFKIAKSSRNSPEFDNERLHAFEVAIRQNQIDVVILDPFVSFHLLAENDTAAMDALVKRISDICIRRDCCVELAHHVRKPGFGQVEITVYDARGAAAIVNAVRSCRVLNQMSIVEAQQVQKPNEEPIARANFIRIDSGKRNMAPPEKARWMQLITVEIANGDKVQALDPYEFRPQQATEADEVWLVRLLSEHKEFRADSRSPDWLGVAVANHFNRGYESKGDVIWLNKQINKWLAPAPPRRKQALIRKVDRIDDERKKRKFFELVDNSGEPASSN